MPEPVLRRRDRWAARIARVRPGPVLIGTWLAAVLYAFPGYLMTDSVDQLYQARTGHFSDWHPPLMAGLWAAIERVITGPMGMLLLQVGLFVAGLAAIFRRRLAPGPAAIATACVVLFPPVLTTMAVVWKDAQMAGFLVAGAALVTSPRRRDVVAGAACLFVAVAVRYNAALALVPITIAAARLHAGPRWRATVAGLAAAVALWTAATAANRALTREETHPWYRSLAMLDLAGTIRHAGPLSDAELEAELAGVPLHVTHDLQRSARAERNWHDWWSATAGDGRLFEPPRSPAERAAVARAWWRLVRDHPIAWVEHRAGVFGVALGLGASPPPGGVVHHYFTLDEQRTNLRFDATRSIVQRGLGGAFDALARTPLYRPILYLVLALVVLARPRWRRGAGVLLASGLLYELGLLVAAPSPDYRYSHWMITCAVVAAVGALASAVPTWRAT